MNESCWISKILTEQYKTIQAKTGAIVQDKGWNFIVHSIIWLSQFYILILGLGSHLICSGSTSGFMLRDHS